MSLPLFQAHTVARPLRPHQHAAMALLKRSLLAGNRRIVLQMPTGAGKTRTAAEIVMGALAKGNRVCFTVPAISLIDQTVDAFEGEGIRGIGVIQSNHVRTDRSQRVQVASVQSLARREIPPCEIVIIDEAHLQFEAVRNWMKAEPNKVFIGLSATPWSRGMAEDWQDLLCPVRTQDLIDAGLLAPFRAFAPSHPDMSGVKTIAGDYHEGQSADVMGGLTADVVQTWLAQAEWRPTLVFAVNRAHAAHLQAEFATAGVAMGYCDANVDLIERKVLFERMARGELAGIVNVGTLTTGVDADVRCIVMARPTKSEMLFVQCVGRGLRTAPGKADCLILDHADNHARLGFVTDIHHDKLLDGKGKNPTRKEQGEPMPRDCKACGTLRPAGSKECPSCGFKPERRSDVEVEEGELIELRKSPKPPKATMAEKQEFYSGLLFIARERGRAEGWASHSYRKKYGVWPNKLDRIAAPPSDTVRGYVRALDIRFAKANGKGAGK